MLKDLLDSFDSAADVNSYFNKWSEYSEADRLDVIRKLRVDGSLAILGHRSDLSLKCPVHKYALAKPCNLDACQYHIQNQESKNCLVAYLNSVKNNRLSASETADVLQTSISEVNSLTNSAVKKIKRAVIHENLEKSQAKRYSYISGHCVHCETFIRDELEMASSSELLLNHGGKLYGWCSLDCKKSKPKWQFVVEKRFGCHYLAAMAATLSTYRKPETVDQLLDLEHGTTGSILPDVKKYLCQMV